MIEVLVAIAILGILTALAIPNFTATIKRYRVNAIRDEISSSLELARITAMTQGVSVFLVRNPACAGVNFSGTRDWSCGWRVIADTNRNEAISATAPVGTVPMPPDRDTLLQTTSVPTGFVLLHNGTGASSITINRWGQIAGTGHNFIVTPENYIAAHDPSSVTCITSGGRIRYIKDDISCP